MLIKFSGACHRRWPCSRIGGFLKNDKGWWVVADSKKIGQEGWLPEYNTDLRQARRSSDAGTHWMVTTRIKKNHFQVWVKKKVRPSKPDPWFSAAHYTSWEKRRYS